VYKLLSNFKIIPRVMSEVVAIIFILILSLRGTKVALRNQL